MVFGGTSPIFAKPKKKVESIFDPNSAMKIPDLASTTEEDKTNKFYYDEKGFPTGIERDGKTYFGLNIGEAEGIIQQEERKKRVQEGIIPSVQQVRQQEAQQAQQAAAAGRLGVTPEQIAASQMGMQEAPIDWGQAGTAGLASAAPGVIGGAIGGATIGALGGPIGAVGGAVLGGTAAFLNGIRSNIKSQQRGEIGAANKVLTNAKSNLRQVRMLAQSDPSRADEAVEIYNQQMIEVHKAHQQLKLETQGNLNKFMDDGRRDLAEFELFLMPNGYADIQRMRIEEVLIGGVALSPEQIMMELNQELSEMDE